MTKKMNANQTRDALRANDENLALRILEEIIAAKDLDAAAAILERIQVAERANTVEDICIEVGDLEGPAAASVIETIKVNF